MEYQPGRKTASGYLAVPESGKGAGVLVLHAWWGLNEFFVALCERLAQQGFVALAPDLYEGKLASTVEEAEQLLKTMDFGAAQSKALESLDFLQHHPATQGTSVGVLGCSLGAAWAFALSAARPETVAAAVIFYGVGEADFAASRATYLGHFAENDRFDPLEDAQKMVADIRAAGREITFCVYPGVGHWFFEENQPEAYNADAAGLAWERTVSFLQSHLYAENNS